MKNNAPANNLRAMRKKAGISQTAIAIKLGLSSSTICRIELRYDAPSREVAGKIAKMLKADVASVFPALADTQSKSAELSFYKEPVNGSLASKARGLLIGRSAAELTRIVATIEAAFPR